MWYFGVKMKKKMGWKTVPFCYILWSQHHGIRNMVGSQSLWYEGTLVRLKWSVYILFNPYHAKFLKWNNPTSIFGTVHY